MNSPVLPVQLRDLLTGKPQMDKGTVTVRNGLRFDGCPHSVQKAGWSDKKRIPVSSFLSGWMAAVVIAIVFTAFPTRATLTLQLVSKFSPPFVYPAGGGGDAGLPTTSADGRYVLFASMANNLVLTTNNTPIPVLAPASLNVYCRDCASNTTVLVSINLAGNGGGNGDSLPVGISPDGRYALFESVASDLVAGDSNNVSDVFVRDLVNGATWLVSVNTNGLSGNNVSRSPAITSDGRYVAFTSKASDLVAGDTNGIADVFIRDLQGNTTTLASVRASPINSSTMPSSSETPAITPDGRYVAFFSTATNLLPGLNLAGEVYVRDLVADATIWASTNARAIAKSVIGSSNVVSCNLSISADGNFVAFEACTNTSTSPSERGIILRYSRQSGLTDLVYTNASVSLAGFENIHSLDMSPDGRFITFVANVNGTSGTNTAIYLWDAQTGTNTLVSADLTNGLPTNAFCDSPVVSSNGQFVAFLSSATNLTTNSLANPFHLYVRNMQTGTTWLVDADTNGVGAGVNSTTVPGMSADGQSVAFESVQSNLAPNDNNQDYDVFQSRPFAGVTELISTHHPALPGGGPTMIWLADPGQNYRVQCNNDLSSTNWLDVTGTPIIIGKRGYITDFAPASDQRFYRGVAN